MINILLCTDNLKQASLFYRALDVQIIAEQHGEGPQHFHFDDVVTMEIYPPKHPHDVPFVIRIDVEDVDEIIKKLLNAFSYEGLIFQEAEDLKTGRKSIVRDPDGRIVELFQPFLD